MSYKNEKLKRVTIVIDEDLDYQFRKIASRKFKFGPKWYSKGISEAIDLWIAENPEEEIED